jgi:hypothetical protein
MGPPCLSAGSVGSSQRPSTAGCSELSGVQLGERFGVCQGHWPLRQNTFAMANPLSCADSLKVTLACTSSAAPQLSPPPQRSPQIDCAYKPAIRIRMRRAPRRNQRACWKVVGGPTRDYDDLEGVGLVGEQSAKPVHASVVTLNQLVVQDNRCLQILR